jgi:hypothetical protein
LILAALISLPLVALAKGDRVEIRPAKNGRYTVSAYTFGPVELTGYLGDLKDTDHITTAVLVSGNAIAAEDSERFGAAVARAGLKAFVRDNAGEREIGGAGTSQ